MFLSQNTHIMRIARSRPCHDHHLYKQTNKHTHTHAYIIYIHTHLISELGMFMLNKVLEWCVFVFCWDLHDIRHKSDYTPIFNDNSSARTQAHTHTHIYIYICMYSYIHVFTHNSHSLATTISHHITSLRGGFYMLLCIIHKSYYMLTSLLLLYKIMSRNPLCGIPRSIW